MWASNFGRTVCLSGTIYAFAMGEGDGHTEEAYEETIELVKSKLMLCEYANEEWVDKSRKILGYIPFTVNLWMNSEETKGIQVIVEHGYHQWARLDISLEDFEDEDCWDSVKYEHVPMRYNKRDFAREIKRIEKVFAEVCPLRLKRVGGFSNGESVYEKA